MESANFAKLATKLVAMAINRLWEIENGMNA